MDDGHHKWAMIVVIPWHTIERIKCVQRFCVETVHNIYTFCCLCRNAWAEVRCIAATAAFEYRLGQVKSGQPAHC